MHHFTCTRIAFALALLGTSAAHATNGYFSHGYGIQAKGAAGVGAALPQDALAAATNPAGIIALGNRLDVGIELFQPKREASISGNAFGPDQTFDGNDSKDFWIPEFGYNRVLSPKLAAGIAVYGNGGMNTDYGSNPYQRFGGQGRAGVNLEQLFISPALAYRLNAQHSIGAAINFAYQRFEARGLGVFGGFSSAPDKLSDNGSDSASGWGVRLGWLGEIDPRLTLGASWQSRTRSGKFEKYQGLFAEQGGFDTPETYVLGISVRPNSNLTLALDWQRINYSEIASVGNPFAPLLQGKALGAADGPGFGWQDQKIVKLAAIYQATPELTLRAGYSDATQPIPKSETFFNILAPGTVQRHLTLGGSWKLDSHNDLSVAYVHGFKQQVNGENSIPPGFPPVGFGGGNANISLEESALGVAWGHKF